MSEDKTSEPNPTPEQKRGKVVRVRKRKLKGQK